MKNIFLIPTKKSRLFKHDSTTKLHLFNEDRLDIHSSTATPQYIYITNNEKISLNNSVYGKHRNVVLQAVDKDNVYFFNLTPSRYKKIVLSNDSSIDVQQVSSSFLSFYAENQPDYVEVKREEDGQYVDHHADGTVTEGIYENYSLNFPQKTTNK